MKKSLSLFLAILCLLGTVHADTFTEAAPGTYELTSYEVGTAVMDASLMPDTSLVLNGDGTGVITVQGSPSEITYAEGTLYVSEHPTYTYEVLSDTSLRVSLSGVLYMNMALTGEAVPNTEPVPTAAPTAAPAAEGKNIPLENLTGAVSITLYRGKEGTRDGGWNKIAEQDKNAAFAFDSSPKSSEPFYKVTAVFSDRTEEYIYAGTALKEKWVYDQSGKLTSGYDYTDEISYEYVYEKGVFKYRKKTYENLKAGVDYTYDDEPTKVSNCTTYAITLAKSYENCVGIGFDFQITKINSGSPFGVWRVYVRLSTKNSWREAATFKVKDGSQVSPDKTFKNSFSIKKVAILGPRVAYSIQTKTAIRSITVKDSTY